MAYTVITPTNYLQAVYNPIILTAKKSDYQVGQYFYCEIWVTDNKNMQVGTNPLSGATMLRTLQLAGNPATKSASFDISNILATVFTASNYQVPNLQQRFQKDESGYVQWFVRMGWIAYNAQNVSIKTEEFVSSGTNFAVRAAITGPDGGMDNYLNRFDYANNRNIQYATGIPDHIKRGLTEPTLLPFFTPVLPSATGGKIVVDADLFFTDGTIETNYRVIDTSLDTGGLYLINTDAGLFTNHLRYQEIRAYSIYVGYYDDQHPTVLYFVDSRVFELKKDVPSPITVTFLNTLGGWDALHFRKDYEVGGKGKGLLFNNTSGQRMYAADLSENITYQSSYLTLDEYIWLKDLRGSVATYVNGNYVSQADGDYKIDTSVGLFTYELVVKPEYEKNTIRF